MPTITSQARSRRRRRKLLLAAMLGGGAVLLGTRISGAADAQTPSTHDYDCDEPEVRGGSGDGEESLREVWQ
jgi:hypothetical protein